MKIPIHNIYLEFRNPFDISSPFWDCLFPLLYNIRLFLETELVTDDDWLATSLKISLSLLPEAFILSSIYSVTKLFKSCLLILEYTFFLEGSKKWYTL